MKFRPWILVLAVLPGSCAYFTETANSDKDNGQRGRKPKENRVESMICLPETRAPSSSATSVDALRPADISAFYTLGFPVSHREEASTVVSRLTELLSMLSPQIITQNVDPVSPKPRTLLEEVEKLTHLLLNEDSDWKFVLLFVSADSICPTSPQATADLHTAVEEVEAALQMLQNTMHKALVHVIVWSTEDQQNECDHVMDQSTNIALQKTVVSDTLQFLLSQTLENPGRKNNSYAVLVHSAPVFLESNSDTDDINHLTLHLWSNMLQPGAVQTKVTDKGVFHVPCPTQGHPYLRTQGNTLKVTAMADLITGTEFPCADHSPSPTIPTSVHELRPGDIKVVAALGDSMTTGIGAGDADKLSLNEFRGLSWSIGGDGNLSTVTTLPNILREFNPSLIGFSKGIGNANSSNAYLNQAVSGAYCRDLVQQARTLVDKMKKDPNINFHTDWKLITVFIGGNDIGHFCEDSVIFSTRNAVHHIKEALDVLHSKVPRALVNLVEVFSATSLREAHKDPTLPCLTVLAKTFFPCLLKPKEGSSELQKVKDYITAFQRGMVELIDSGHYDTSDNFTVVLQPFWRDWVVPSEDGRIDPSGFIADCFHPSQLGHTHMARALWNNMLEPVGHKSVIYDPQAFTGLKCPSETNPFIRTAGNSNYTFPGPKPTPPPSTNWGSNFSCVNTSASESVPTSVDRLRPADIKVVAALGDSVTAGFGAKATNLSTLRTEFRGVSWSIGGDDTLETVTTLPNILKKFNPDVKGASKGTGKKETGFNMAVSGAVASGVPQQVRRLIDSLKNDSEVDFQNDWKLVTLFIGGNDLCGYCYNRATLSPQNYSHHIRTSLDMLYTEVPRTLVNILQVMEIEGLRKIKRDSVGCRLSHRIICPCVLPVGEDSLEFAELKRINREMQDETEKLVYSGRYDGREDFAVVVQPFFKNTVLPLSLDGRPDTTFFSEDCFHFSERGHAEMAVALWNNMLEPVGEKNTYNEFTIRRNIIKCPSEEHPYIFTKMNSLSPSTTTVSPTTHSTAQPLTPLCPDTVPVWLAAVLAVGGLGIGLAITCFLFFFRAKKTRKLTMT